MNNTILDQLVKALERAENAEENLRMSLGALESLYNDTVDYITINHLGDVHHNHSMKLAHAVLTKLDRYK